MANNWQLGITIHFPPHTHTHTHTHTQKEEEEEEEEFYNQKQNKRGISSPNQYAPTSFFPF